MRKDRSAAYRRDCHVDSDEVAADPCLFGKEDGVRVIHYGDSHAANWIPALAEIAEQSGWRLETHTRSACSIFKKMAMTGDQPDPLCKLWGENVMAELSRSPPEIVIMTQSQSRKVVAGDTQPDDDATAAATAEVWRELLSLGVKVVAIRDTPQLPFKPDECLLRNLGCYAKQSEALSYVDPILIAHRMVPEVPIIDMTDALCHDGRCPMIIGNIVVWRDTHHLTASYARSAASVLGERIMSALQHHERARYARKNAGGSGVTRAP